VRRIKEAWASHLVVKGMTSECATDHVVDDALAVIAIVGECLLQVVPPSGVLDALRLELPEKVATDSLCWRKQTLVVLRRETGTNSAQESRIEGACHFLPSAGISASMRRGLVVHAFGMSALTVSFS